MTAAGHNSITRKLTWMNMLTSGAALILACAAFTTYDLITFRTAMVSSLSIQAQMIGTNSISALLFGDPDSAYNTLLALKATPHVQSAEIYAADGHRFASYGKEDGVSLSALPAIKTGEVEAHQFQRNALVVVHPILFQGATVGTVYMRSDLDEVGGRLEHFGEIAAAVLLLSLLAALVVSRLARRAISEPLRNLAETAATVSRDKNYTLRAAPTMAGAELAVLVDAFNGMLAQIEVRDARLQKAHDELEHRVEERTHQLGVANRELEAFSYSVSHDLRAPLRSIDGFSQALLEDYADRLDDTGKNYLDRVRGATQRMGSLIDDLLNLSRVSRNEMKSETLDLSAIASSVVDDLRRADPKRQVDVVIAEGVTAQGDSRLVRVALENLIGNAWKYTSRHRQARIEFGRKGQNGSSAFFVRDDGAGFDPQYADKLFRAFQRLHGPSEFPGTGIGLATVQRVIRRHGGDIWAEGAVEKGATFYFTLQ